MSIIDLILLIILAGFIFYGFFFGLVRTIGSLVGVVAGVWLTLIFYLTAFDLIKDLFFGYELIGKIVTFILLFTLINRLVGFLFALADKTFNLISIIPFLKTINRLAGAVLGALEGGLVLGLALLYVSQTAFGGWFSNSQVAPFLIDFSKTIAPFLPVLLERIKMLA